MSWFDYAGSQRFEAGIPTGEPKVPTVIRAKDGTDASGNEVGPFGPYTISKVPRRLGPRFSLLDYCRATRTSPDDATRLLWAMCQVGYFRQDGIEPIGGPVFVRTPRFAAMLGEN